MKKKDKMQYPDGGKTPIYTSNKSDPRIKAYNDSLALYNSSKNNVADLKMLMSRGLPSDIIDDVWLNQTKAFYQSQEGIKGQKAYDALTKLNKKSPLPETTYKATPNSVARIYKKPVQPVLYKPEVTKESPIVSKPNLIPPIVSVDTIPQNGESPYIFNEKDFGKYYGTHNTKINDYYYMNHKTGKMYSPEEYKSLKSNKFSKGGKIPKYGIGATIGGIAGTIGLGSVNPLLGGVGAYAGSYLGGLFDSPEEVEMKTPELRVDTIRPNPKQMYGNSRLLYKDGGFMQDNSYTRNYWDGRALMGHQPAEVEKEEVAITPDGQTLMFDGPSHADGGIKTTLPEGTKITSDRLINPLTNKTFAKDQAKIERNRMKQDKRLTIRPNDLYLKNSVDRNDVKSEQIFQLQEMTKMYQEPEAQEYRDGGTIHIKPENRGKFNALKKRTGKTTEELTHSKNPLTRKRAIFALNASRWNKKEYGGFIEGSEHDLDENQIQNLINMGYEIERV